MLLFKDEYSDKNYAFNEALEKVFEMIEGAYEWDLDGLENIYPLERREISLRNEDGEYVGRAMIEIYPADEEGYYIVEAYLMDGNISPLHLVYTAREAEELWELGQNTVVKWIERGKFKINEYRKSKGTWLVTHKGMERVAGRLDDSWMKEIDSIKKEQPFIYREVEFYNIDTLEKFLRTHLKDHLAKRLEDEKEILLYLDEIMNEESSYELPSYQTRSGNAENIYFKRVDEVDEETGEIKTIIRF